MFRVAGFVFRQQFAVGFQIERLLIFQDFKNEVTQNLADQVDSIMVQVIRVGDLAFVGIPGEPFNEFGMEIKTIKQIAKLENLDKLKFPRAKSRFKKNVKK